MSEIAKNWKRIQERIAEAAINSGRNFNEIKIVAVSKTFPAEIIEEAVEAGVTIIGENRIQEAWQKYQRLGNIASWHLIGHLQTNKVKRAIQIFDVIHSVDSLHLAEEISRRCEQRNKDVEILLEVKTSDESTKFGISSNQALELARKVVTLPHLRLTGLMTIGKFTSNEKEVRECFQMLRQVKDQINSNINSHKPIHHLSMGMSHDFEWAIEEGATMVRIGTAIFGQRQPKQLAF